MKFGIIGMGRIGTCLAKKILHDDALELDELRLGDSNMLEDIELQQRFRQLDVTNNSQLESFMNGLDGLISAGPWFINKTLVQKCVEMKVAYFDFTEDVETTNFIKQLDNPNDVTLIPQCGLAPGAVNILAGDLIRQFDIVHDVQLRVGALPLNASNALKYHLTWSTDGLVNEYINPCDMIVDGIRLKENALDGLESITIDGIDYEAFNTSGGIGSMCETFAGAVRSLNYKTMRYPGHQKYMKFLLDDLGMRNNRDLLIRLLNENIPHTAQDVVRIYINVTGIKNGRLTNSTHTRKILGDNEWTAIQLATTMGAYGVIRLWHDILAGWLLSSQIIPITGFIKQETIPYKLWSERTLGIYAA